ncbi:MAG: M48 family metalloprotease [Alphaproteobacteria bacterium]|nr:M48 family metalloprotease [Alphaproteobacteria bacterium]
MKFFSSVPFFFLRRFFVGLPLIFILGCNFLSESRPVFETDSAVESRFKWTGTGREKSEVTASEHQRILLTFGGIYHLPKLKVGLKSLIDRLIYYSDKPLPDCEVLVLDSPLVNAFLLPGGHLYLTRGLLALVNDEDELAAILAHEIGHLVASHSSKRHEEMVFLKRPSENRLVERRKKDLLARFSRQQELEADQIGMKIAVKAGFDPFASVSFLESIIRDTKDRKRRFGRQHAGSELLSTTHPSPPERINRLWDLAHEMGFFPEQRKRHRVEYLRMIDGMIYSDSPRDGYVRGRSFFHTGMKITFSVPRNFSLYNAKDAVFAIGPDDTAMRFDGVFLEGEYYNLETYVRSVWGSRITLLKSFEEEGQGHYPLIYGSARSGGWTYRMAALRANETEVFRFLLARRGMPKESERAFESIVRSLRPLGKEEVAHIFPLRLRIVIAQPTDTVRSLSSRFHLGDHAEQAFRLLNGLSAGEKVEPGQPVKIITDW